MAKKKKRPGKRKTTADLGAALDALTVVEKDVAKARRNLREFLREAEKYMSGGSHHLPPPRRKK